MVGVSQKAAASAKWCLHQRDRAARYSMRDLGSPSVKLLLWPEADRGGHAGLSPWGSSLTTASMFSPFTYSVLSPSEK